MLEVAIGPAAVSPNIDVSAPFQRFGDYELVEEIARGGMGVVYKARQISLGRVVALKMILSGRLASEVEVRRFHEEARAAAALHHPGIVAIHEVGEIDGQPYFSMDLVEGRNLAEAVRDGPFAAARAAACVQSVAEAIHYAHEYGILHRDLKPSNVLIDANGKPHVTDFGLAKQLSSDNQLSTNDPQLTLSGQVLGSPNFIPPEQAAGKHAQLGPASDVYSLGALLYHLLTGRPPFLADSVAATLRLVAENEPVSPRVLVPMLPRDLETICLKCLEKDPQRRYGTAKDLMDELDRFLRDEPIRARPVGRGERFYRWTRRHPIIAALTGIIGALLVTVALITSVAAVRLQRANRDGQEKLREAYLAEARAHRWSGRPGRRFDSLEAIRKAAAIRPGIDLGNEAIAAMALVDVRTIKRWDVPEAIGWGFDANLTRYSRPEGHAAVVRRVADDVEVARVAKPGATNCYYVSLGSDGRQVIAGFKREGHNPFVLFDLRGGKATLQEDDLWLRSHHFSQDGRRLMVTSHRRPAGAFSILFDLETCQPVATNRLAALASWTQFNPAGDKVAISYLDHPSVEIRDPLSGAILEELPHASGVHTVGWSPDGSQLATGGADQKMHLWEVDGRPRLLRSFPHRGNVVRLRFNPSGTHLVSYAWDSIMRFWDPVDGQELLRLPSAGGSMQMTPDGRRFIGAPSPHTLALMEIEDAREWRRLRYIDRGGNGTRSCAFSPDGRLLVSSHRDGLRLWDLSSGTQAAHLDSGGEMNGAMFHPSGTNLVVVPAGRPIELWPLTSDGPETASSSFSSRLNLGPPFAIPGSKPMQSPQLDRTGRTVSGMADGRLRVFDLESGRFTRAVTVPIQPHRSALAPSGEWGLVAPYRLDEHRLSIHEMSTGQAVHFFEMTGVNSGAFSPDSRLLLAGSPRAVRCVEVGSWKMRYEFARQSTGDNRPVFAFASDGALGAVTISQHAIRLFELSMGKELATLEAPNDSVVHYLAFSPDNGTLAVANRGPSIHLWDLRAIRRQLSALKLDWNAPPLREPGNLPPSTPLTVTVQGDSKLDFPSRDPRSTTNQIDLTGFYNATLTNSWFNPKWKRNDLSELPRGWQQLGGVAFDIRGIVQLSSSHPDLALDYPTEVGRIPVRQPARMLHFLHSAGWGTAQGADIGEYVIHYQDRSERSVPLTYAENIWNWWDTPGKTAPMSPGTTLAWRGTNPMSNAQGIDLLLFHFRWVNPRPGVPIESVTFRSRGTRCAPFLLAITAE